MTITILGITITVTRTANEPQETNWYPGQEKQPSFYEETQLKAMKLWPGSIR